jgi:hypothetical protein
MDETVEDWSTMTEVASIVVFTEMPDETVAFYRALGLATSRSIEKPLELSRIPG